MKLSASKISTFQDCPRKYWYVYELFMQTPKSEGFYFGSAVHKGCEHFYTGKDPMQGVKDALYGEKKKVGETAKEGIDLAKLEKEAQRIFDIYPSQAPYFQPVLVEYRFTVPLVHPETREALPIEFTGVMDLVTADGVVVDHKTASGSPNGFFEEKNKFQAGGYAYAYWMKFGKLPSGFVFNNIIKGNSKREPRFEPKTLDIGLGDLCFFFDTCKFVYDAIARKETRDYPNTYHCRFCPFKAICTYAKK